VLEILVILLLVLLNGFFALSELAIVSARRARLRSYAEAGRRGAKTALELSDDPGRFLPTVQIGITLVGIIAGAFSGATLGEEFEQFLGQMGLPPSVAQPVGYVAVIAAITYLSLVIGELVPKNLALRHPESIACAVAPVMAWISRFGAPFVYILDRSTRFAFRLIGHQPQAEESVTAEEIKSLVAEAESAGVLETDERHLISGVLRLGDRAVRGLMTPRTDVDWIDLSADDATIKTRLLSTSHSRLPVADGSIDTMVGAVHARELLTDMLDDKPLDVRGRIRKAPIIPESMDALDVLAVLRNAEVPMALVHDEYGHFEGLVTPADILEAIAGAFRSDLDDPDEPDAVERDDGSWLLSGSMAVDEMADKLGIKLPEKRDYQTVAGFVLAALKRLPTVGESVRVSGWRFEVVDLDGRRIDKVLAIRLVAPRRIV
jgi:putative hemolysin